LINAKAIKLVPNNFKLTYKAPAPIFP